MQRIAVVPNGHIDTKNRTHTKACGVFGGRDYITTRPLVAHCSPRDEHGLATPSGNTHKPRVALAARHVKTVAHVASTCADALLIAAAPDLLAVLLAFVDCAPNIPEPLKSRAQAAVSKAEGR